MIDTSTQTSDERAVGARAILRSVGYSKGSLMLKYDRWCNLVYWGIDSLKLTIFRALMQPPFGNSFILPEGTTTQEGDIPVSGMVVDFAINCARFHECDDLHMILTGNTFAQAMFLKFGFALIGPTERLRLLDHMLAFFPALKIVEESLPSTTSGDPLEDVGTVPLSELLAKVRRNSH